MPLKKENLKYLSRGLLVILAIFGFLLAILISKIFYEVTIEDSYLNDKPEKHEVAENTSLSDAVSTNEVATPKSDLTPTKINQAEHTTKLPDRDELIAGKDLLKTYGHFSDEETEVYNTYSDETLKSLGEGGDLLALQVILNRAMDNYTTDSTSAKNAAYEAIVHGSTISAMTMGFITQDERLTNPNKPDYKEALIESLAWFEFGIIRGDPYLVNITKSQKSSNRFKSLTSEDFEKAKTLAKQLHDQVNQERLERGMGEFENEGELFKLDKFSNLYSGE